LNPCHLAGILLFADRSAFIDNIAFYYQFELLYFSHFRGREMKKHIPIFFAVLLLLGAD
jgi:hypothetical protein